MGHSVACLFLMFGSIISGTSLKNSRYYNEGTLYHNQLEDDKVNKRSKLYNAYVTADMLGTVNDESTAIPLIVYLLYNVILITCLHTLFGSDGYIYHLYYLVIYSLGRRNDNMIHNKYILRYYIKSFNSVTLSSKMPLIPTIIS